MTSKDDHRVPSERHIESRTAESAGEAAAGKPIVDKTDNAIHQRAELLSSLRVHRFTNPDQQAFSIRTGSEEIQDRRSLILAQSDISVSSSRAIEKFSAKSENEDNREHFGNVIREKNANRDHAQRVEAAIEALPERVQNFIAAHHIKIVAARTIVDEFPGLANDHPRDWPPGKTWKHVEGTFRTDHNEVVLSELVLGPDNQWHKNSRLEGVARHETGHAVDHALNDFSLNDKSFIEAYNAEKAKLSPAERKTLEYILQKGAAGQQEAFGELFATLYGGASLDVTGTSKYTELLKKCFPKTLEVIKNKMESI